MDSERFDTITRTLASGRSRRGALRLLAGGTVASIGLARVVIGTEAQSGRACCAQRRKACIQLCQEEGKRLDNARFTCDLEACKNGLLTECDCV